MTRRLGLAAVSLALAAGCSTAGEKEAVATVSSTLSVKVQAARTQTLKDAIAAPGTIVPSSAGDLLVIAPELCDVAELPAPEGATVKAGDLLVRFDIASVTADLAAKQQDVDQATARLSAAKDNLTKQTDLYSRSVIPKTAVDSATAAVSAADAELTHAQTMLKAASTLASRATVRAPFTGTLVKRFHAPGESVRPSSDDPVLRLIDPTRLQVAVHVTAGQVIRITPGQAATITDVTTGTSFPGTVVARPVVQDPAATSAEIRLASSAPTPLALDTVVQTEIVLDVRENVLAVPTAAIQKSGATAFVMVAGDDGKAHRHDVQVGITGGPFTQIYSGISAGDQVIVTALDQVTDGMAIDIER